MNRLTKSGLTTLCCGVLAASTFGLGEWLSTYQNAAVQCFPGVLVDAVYGNYCLGVETAIAGLALVGACAISMIRVK